MLPDCLSRMLPAPSLRPAIFGPLSWMLEARDWSSCPPSIRGSGEKGSHAAVGLMTSALETDGLSGNRTSCSSRPAAVRDSDNSQTRGSGLLQDQVEVMQALRR